MRRVACVILLLLASAACAGSSNLTLGGRAASFQPTGFPNYCGESLECLIGRSESLVHGRVLSINTDSVADLKVLEVFKGNLVRGTTIRLSVGGATIKIGQEAIVSIAGVYG